MAKHTPGPWTIEDRLERLLIWADGRHDSIAQLSTDADGVDDQETIDAVEAEQHANAALISAAPDLFVVLSAIEWVQKRDGVRCPKCDGSKIRGHKENCSLRAALNKAVSP